MKIEDQVFEDLKGDYYPSDEQAFGKIKCSLNAGKRVYWYYKEDAEYAKENEFDIREEPGYSGVLIPPPHETMASPDAEIETERCIVVMTEYPAQKEYCEACWVSLHRLIDNSELVEIFSDEQETA